MEAVTNLVDQFGEPAVQKVGCEWLAAHAYRAECRDRSQSVPKKWLGRCHLLRSIGVYWALEAHEYQCMPKLPDMSAAAIKRRKAMTKAAELERAKEPPPAPVVKIRMAKPR
jgi:hypothetical protein